MPELPEVETSLRGITPHIVNQYVSKIIVRCPKLRWPIPTHLCNKLKNKEIFSTSRRGKYILIHFATETLIFHLGMSGSLRILSTPLKSGKHDHIDIVLSNGKLLRMTDPRRFGACLLITGNPNLHPLLKDLGLEPLTPKFTGKYLWEKAQHRRAPIKSFIMNHKIVVGVGNIYACEALFRAEILPTTPAYQLSHSQMNKLANAIKFILKQAIKKGGTTLKDFIDSNGKPGYFSQSLKVYGREGLPCVRCHHRLSAKRIGQRSTFYCSVCQI